MKPPGTVNGEHVRDSVHEITLEERTAPFLIPGSLDSRTRSRHLSSLTSHFYCASEKCTFSWRQGGILTAVSEFTYILGIGEYIAESISHPFRFKPTRQRTLYFCQNCSHSLTPVQKRASIPVDFHPGTTDPTNKQKLLIYSSLVKNCKQYLTWLAVLVAGFPLLGVLLELPTKKCLPLPLQELWRIVPKFYSFLLFVYAYGAAVGITVSFPFRSQVVFWSLLEIYTILIALVGILSIASKRQLVGASPNSELDFGYGILWVIFPTYKLFREADVLCSAPPSLLVGHASSYSRNFDLCDAIIQDSAEQKLSDKLLPGAFMSYRVKEICQKRMGLTWLVLLILSLGIICYYVVLTVAWTTGVFTSVPYELPGLVKAPRLVNFTVSGNMSPLCVKVTSGYQALWNLELNPTPTAILGLPALLLQFSSGGGNSTSYEISTSWMLDITYQDGYSVVFNPQRDQAAFSFVATFYNATSCAVVSQMTPQVSTEGNGWLIQDYVDLQSSGFAPFALFILFKYIVQYAALTLAMSKCSIQIWRLWIHLDTITSVGLFPPLASESIPPTPFHLTVGSNLEAWYRVRCGVLEGAKLYLAFLNGFALLGAFQLAIGLGGALCYCFVGTAPVPTYYLLVGAAIGSLPTILIFLPVALAGSIQGSHGVLLRNVHLELTSQLHRQGSTASHHLASLEKYLDKLVLAVSGHEDRVGVWGAEITLSRLFYTSIIVAAGVAYIGCQTIDYSWDPANSYYYFNYGE